VHQFTFCLRVGSTPLKNEVSNIQLEVDQSLKVSHSIKIEGISLTNIDPWH